MIEHPSQTRSPVTTGSNACLEDTRDTSILQQRVDRAGANLQVGLVPFLALCLLSLQIDVDISATATYWLGLRAIYVPLYMAGTNVVRSVVWVASTACLIYMAMQLL